MAFPENPIGSTSPVAISGSGHSCCYPWYKDLLHQILSLQSTIVVLDLAKHKPILPLHLSWWFGCGPLPGFQWPPGWHDIFRIGDSELNLHLPRLHPVRGPYPIDGGGCIPESPCCPHNSPQQTTCQVHFYKIQWKFPWESKGTPLQEMRF